MLRSAFQALLDGDPAERDRLVSQIFRNRRNPEAAITAEMDSTMAQDVNALGREFVSSLQRVCPEVFAGDARSTATATLALAETLGGVLASAQMHGGQTRVEAIMRLFSERCQC